MPTPGTVDECRLGWLRRNDPRSELVSSMLQEGHGFPLLLNGIDRSNTAFCHNIPDPGVIAYISPLSHVRKGSYKTPTFLIHGTEDEIVPFHTAQNFCEALKKAGVDGGLSVVEGAQHTHDLTLKDGDRGWLQGVGIGYRFLFKKLGFRG